MREILSVRVATERETESERGGQREREKVRERKRGEPRSRKVQYMCTLNTFLLACVCEHKRTLNASTC